MEMILSCLRWVCHVLSKGLFRKSNLNLLESAAKISKS